VPFRAAIEAGADAVMTAHLVADALDGEPVSLSARWTELLRTELAFDGVVITDALDMEAVAEGRGIDGVAAAAVRAVQAGADLLCLGSNFDDVMIGTVIEAVLRAVDAGRIDRARLELSAKRIGMLRRPATVAAQTAMDDARARVAAAAIEVDGELPGGPFAVLECRPTLSMANFNVAWGIAGDAAERGWPVWQMAQDDPVDEAFLRRTAGLPLLVVVRDSGVHSWQRDVAANSAAARPDTVVVEFGWPPSTRPGCRAFVTTHGAARVSALALLDRLARRFPGRVT